MVGSRAHDVSVVPTGVQFGEGPVWCADDSTIVCTGVADGKLHRVWPESGRRQVIGETGGGPNACALAEDGSFLVTQNGGIDFALHNLPGLDDIPPLRRVTPGLQRVAPDGTISVVAERCVDGSAFLAPNDLVTTDDGTVFFTDPGHHPLPPDPAGRVLRLDPDGAVHPVAGPFRYCNGIALDHRDDLVIVEANGLMRVGRDGSTEWIVEDMGAAGDGMAVDVAGTMYVCSPAGACVYVVSPDGEMLDTIAMPAPGFVTNCCFGGPDGRTLFVTMALARALAVIEDLPRPGVAIHPWPGVTAGR